MHSQGEPSLLDVCLAALLLVVVMSVSVIQARAEVAFREGYLSASPRDPECLVLQQRAALWSVPPGRWQPFKSAERYRALGRRAVQICPPR